MQKAEVPVGRRADCPGGKTGLTYRSKRLSAKADRLGLATESRLKCAVVAVCGGRIHASGCVGHAPSKPPAGSGRAGVRGRVRSKGETCWKLFA